jgi:spermidine synthase
MTSRRLNLVRRDVAGTFTVDTATAELVRDGTRRNAFTLLLDGVETSHVDLDDPTYLAFEYVQWFAAVADCLAASGEPLDTVHIGGGAATFARYLAATRPRSRQTVLEIDAALVALVRARLPLPKTRLLRVRIADGRLGLAALPRASADLVVRDAFRDARAPEHLRTVEFSVLVSESLRPGGTYLINVADGVPYRHLGPDVATVAEVFAHVAVVSEPSVLRGRRHGNLVVCASNSPLPVDAIARAVAGGPVRGRIKAGAEARAMARGFRPVRDADVS